MRFVFKLICGLTAIFLGGACVSLADRDNPLDENYQGPRGGLKGKLVLRSGTAIHVSETTGKATINYAGVAVSMDRLPKFTTMSTESGEFDISRIPVGTWKFTLSAPGYVTESVSVVIRKNEVTEIPVVNINEQIAGKLVFGSSRDGFPKLFETNAVGMDFKSLSSLPIKNNYCRYGVYEGKSILVVQSDFVVYQKDGEYKTGAGMIISEYPSLEMIDFVPSREEIQRPTIHPNGKLIFGLNIGADAFIAEVDPKVTTGSNADPEDFRITGVLGDKWAESSPTVSPTGKIAYIRFGMDIGETTPLYEIRVLDGTAGPGKLVHRRNLGDMAFELAKQLKFDFDGDKKDDLIKLITVTFRGGNQLTLTPGIDWSEDIDNNDKGAFLEGSEPDGIVLNVYQLVNELLQLGAIRDLNWLPDDQTLIFVDRLLSNPGVQLQLLWEIKKNGSYVQDITGAVVKEPTNGRPTLYYTDIDLNGTYSAAVDKPFWYESPSSYIKAADLNQKRIEIQAMRKIRVDNDDPAKEAEPFFVADLNQWIFTPAVSADGKRVAMALGPAQSLIDNFDVSPMMTEGNIVTVDPANSFVTRITSDGYNNRAPCWVP